MDSEVLDRPRTERPLPQIENFVIIIGAMKSGTTTLYKYLAQHPQILGSRWKEPNFFGLKRKWAKGAEAYLKLWPDFDPAVHRYALEASTHYTKAPRVRNVSRRIRRFGRSFRYIYIVRNPLDRIESHLAHNIAKGRLPFEVDVAGELPRRAVQVSSYAYQLDTFRAGLAEPEILILDFAEFCRTPLDVVDRCVRFLGLDPFVFSPVEPANVRKSVNRADEFRMDADQRARLAEQLRADVRDFRDRYGFDVSGWSIV
jgi:hypothetical protein